MNGPFHAFYRVHGSNMHLTQFSTMPFDLRARAATFDTLSEGATRDHFPDSTDWVNRARRALARESLILVRRELDQGHPRESVQPLIDVARETYAPIKTSRHMRRIDDHPGVRRPVWIACTRIAEAMRWRIWRQLGID